MERPRSVYRWRIYQGSCFTARASAGFERSIMRRTYLVVILSVTALLLPVAFGQTRPALVDQSGFADSIVVNAKVVSMDDRTITPDKPGHIYEAMAIKGKRIMALGTQSEIKA